jgi:hypothetical protein
MSIDSPEEVQWRNIRAVVKTLADWAFESQDHPKWGSAWLAMVTGLTAKDGPQFLLEKLPPSRVTISDHRPKVKVYHFSAESRGYGSTTLLDVSSRSMMPIPCSKMMTFT